MCVYIIVKLIFHEGIYLTEKWKCYILYCGVSTTPYMLLISCFCIYIFYITVEYFTLHSSINIYIYIVIKRGNMENDICIEMPWTFHSYQLHCHWSIACNHPPKYICCTNITPNREWLIAWWVLHFRQFCIFIFMYFSTLKMLTFSYCPQWHAWLARLTIV